MKRDDIKKLFPEATDAQVDEILNINSSDIGKTKKVLDEEKAELERLKAIESEFEETKKTSQTKEQKLDAALDKAAKAEKDFNIQKNRLAVEKLFVTAGLSETDYSELLDSIVSDNAETSNKTANGFISLLKAQKEATEKSVRAAVLKETPKPKMGGGDSGEVTKERFTAMGYGERVKLFQENPELYNELNGGNE